MKHISRLTPVLAPLAGALLVSAAGAGAQDLSAPGEELVAPFSECGDIADRDRRLDCFDAALAGLAEARRAASVRSEAEVVAGFGLPARERERPDAAQAARIEAQSTIIREEDQEIAISSRVADVYTADGRRAVVLLENGQLWREGSNSSLRGEPKVGWTATVRSGPFGSGFRMRFEEKGGFLAVTRVR